MPAEGRLFFSAAHAVTKIFTLSSEAKFIGTLRAGA